jgi:hypothetical protein
MDRDAAPASRTAAIGAPAFGWSFYSWRFS